MAEPSPPTRPSASLPFRVRALLPLLLLLLGYASVQLYSRVPERPLVELSGASMGTTWSVKLAVPALDGADRTRVVQAIAERLERVDALMSTWRDDSELSRFNATRSSEPAAIAPETRAVVAVAQAVAERSRGAFDVTVGPLVQAWGFGSRGPTATPTGEALEAIRAEVGFEKLQLDLDGGTLAKATPALEVDLSALAKGFAVDALSEALLELGYGDALVEIGGELRALGAHRDGSPWRVAIEVPDAPGRQIHRIVELSGAMATSGDYRNYVERDGVRYSHTIDPRTGRPIAHTLASVTVLHPEAVWADAWATALNVLGPDEGYALALEEDLAAYFLERRGEGFAVRTTPGFEPFLAKELRRP